MSPARDDRPYSRVYHEAVADPKFREVWLDDRALATWLRLLISADQAWPAPAMLYQGVAKATVALLVRVGLVRLERGPYYVIVGLDEERRRRSTGASKAAQARWHGREDDPPDPPDESMPTRRPRNGPRTPTSDADRIPETMPSRDEPSQDETRREVRAGAAEPDDRQAMHVDWPDLQLLAESLTGKPYAMTNGYGGLGAIAHDTLERHGYQAVSATWRQIAEVIPGGKRPTLNQLVFGARDALDRPPKLGGKVQEEAGQAAILEQLQQRSQANRAARGDH